MADTTAVARRFALDRAVAEEVLLDDQALGLVTRTEFAGVGGWSLTDAGRHEDERRLAAELDEAGAREAVAGAHAEFVRLNARFLETVTRWQLGPTARDGSEWRRDERVVDDLGGISRRLRPLGERLAASLARFAGYPERFDAALDRVRRGERRWVDEPSVDSCHTVWFELHEDLLATLGLDRGQGA